MTARHRRAVVEAIDSINAAARAVGEDGEEVAAMMIRSACESLANIEQPGSGHIDEEVLDRIFGRFCIGK
jgi:tRNA U34 5-carboxymethylaminomethyl modifying GTPase MnmE/TrmE